MRNTKIKTSHLLLGLIIIGAILRIYGVDWDHGLYLHPDERLYVNASNISIPQSIQDFFSPNSLFNPKMFYYGPFPLYLYILAAKFVLPFGFLFSSRLISSFFSIATIPIVYFIATYYLSKRSSIIAAFIFTFAVGSIQYAHFNTTESLLIFLVSLITLLSIKLLKEKRYSLVFLLGIFLAISYSTKITGLTFSIIPATSLILMFKEKVSRWKIFKMGAILAFSMIFFGLILAPYQLIDFQHFYQEQEYMQGVTYGKYKPPFIIIYENSLPYIYPVIKVLPFNYGFLSLPISFVGLYFLIKYFKKSRNSFVLFIVLYPLLYFAWSGAWYAKFARYYILLLPFFSIWAAFAIEEIKLKQLKLTILLLIAVNGIIFARVFSENTRIEASKWIYNNVEKRSVIGGEHWDDNLPLTVGTSVSSEYQLLQLNVYDPESMTKINTLAERIASCDYIILSSRRVYYSILENKKIYPYTSNFYNKLFDRELGYTLVKSFNNYPFIFSDDFADETFQSYDHPPVLIFKNNAKFSSEIIGKKILSE